MSGQKSRTGKQKDPIVEAMTHYAHNTFTTPKQEQIFLSELKPEQVSLYYKAKAEKQAELERFLQFYWKHQGRGH